MAPLEHAAQRAACPVLRSQVCACVCVVCAHGHVGAACGVENGQRSAAGHRAQGLSGCRVRERGGVVPRMALGRETRDCTVCTPRENKGAFNLEFVCVLGHGVTAVLYLCAGRARGC